MDYSQTLNLPKTEFPMRASLPQREPEILKKWLDEDLYGRLMEHNEGKPLFILHDGPPYANGDMHMGHALNKTLKDIITRYKNMSGFKAPYIHGWDTHGLPIERQAISLRWFLFINRPQKCRTRLAVSSDFIQLLLLPQFPQEHSCRHRSYEGHSA